MTKKAMADVRAMGLAEAEESLLELKAELGKERAVIASGTRPENPGNIRKIRRDIARILTVINEKRMAGETTVEKVKVEERKEGVKKRKKVVKKEGKKIKEKGKRKELVKKKDAKDIKKINKTRKKKEVKK